MDVTPFVVPHPVLKHVGAWSSKVLHWFSVMSWLPEQESATTEAMEITAATVT